MLNIKNRTWALVAGVAALQTATLGYIVYKRVALLASGREIAAEVIPVDPRDLFRGDYVILGYTFAQRGEVPVPDATRTGATLYVTLKPAGGAKWDIASVSARYPETTAAENVVIKGIVNHVLPKTDTTPAMASLRYGIESYFVPEGTGRELEEKVRDKRITAILAVGRNGDVAIKGLSVDGERIVEEPLL